MSKLTLAQMSKVVVDALESVRWRDIYRAVDDFYDANGDVSAAVDQMHELAKRIRDGRVALVGDFP